MSYIEWHRLLIEVFFPNVIDIEDEVECYDCIVSHLNPNGKNEIHVEFVSEGNVDSDKKLYVVNNSVIV